MKYVITYYHKDMYNRWNLQTFVANSYTGLLKILDEINIHAGYRLVSVTTTDWSDDEDVIVEFRPDTKAK